MLAVTARNLSLAVILREVVDVLESHAIPVIPFKGPALAVEAFGGITYRQFDDLDIFIRREDLRRTSERLREAGYVALNTRLDQRLDVILRSEKHVLFAHPSARALIEVHWAVAEPSCGLALNDVLMWQASNRVNVAGRSMRSVPSDVLLLMLSIHGGHHQWRRLGWIADVAALVHRCPELRWKRLRREARRIGAERLVHVALGLARQAFGTPVPDDMLGDIEADRASIALREEIWRDLFRSPPLKRETLTRIAFHCRTRERWVDKTRRVLGLVEPNEKDLDSIELPAALAWLYYGVRPFRLAVDRSRRVASMFARSRATARVGVSQRG
jgi:hypothetical protein